MIAQRGELHRPPIPAVADVMIPVSSNPWSVVRFAVSSDFLRMATGLRIVRGRRATFSEKLKTYSVKSVRFTKIGKRTRSSRYVLRKLENVLGPIGTYCEN